MGQLLLSDLWPTIAKLSKRAAHVQAAIAYVSTAERLNLRAGDVLVVDASPNAIKTAQTSAKVLQSYQQAGVAIFNSAGLHAKLLLIDDKLIVGSGNASGSSANRLTEAAILTIDSTLVRQAQSFVFQLAKQSVPLNAAALARLAKIKVERRFFPVGHATTRPRINATGKTSWIAMIVDATERTFAQEGRRVAAAERVIGQRVPVADPIPVKFWGNLGIRKRVQNGDSVCAGWAKRRGETPYRIDPPSAVLYCQKSDRSTLLYYDPDLSRAFAPVKWREFQRLLKTAAIPPIKPTSIRAITTEQAGELQRIWPRRSA